MFFKKIYSNGNDKNKAKMNNPIYLGLLISVISKIRMYEFWYDYMKLKYEEKAKLCYMDTDKITIHVTTESIYEKIAADVDTRFGTSDYDLNRPLPRRKNSKVTMSYLEK